MTNKRIGWSPNSFFDMGDDVWEAPADAIVANYYMIEQRLYQVMEVIMRADELIGNDGGGDYIKKQAYSVVKLRRVGTAETVELIEAQLNYAFSPLRFMGA